MLEVLSTENIEDGFNGCVLSGLEALLGMPLVRDGRLQRPLSDFRPRTSFIDWLLFIGPRVV